ncbi:MAG: hypothetical protein OZSIB_0844 [Candidatus Ozemobacter sibiricus]|uniref:Uncharacterized protein n=1 Tax=Candidatus Ozemobacter sibiricus TaxID=2268124 RepID=A0A367ZUJ1_9BACT|nr:MAG: hypothetical protein OZSIB_0844 [Candidatus Ozemobacter sibiricus]
MERAGGRHHDQPSWQVVDSRDSQSIRNSSLQGKPPARLG